MRKAYIVVSALLLLLSAIGVALTLSGAWAAPAGRWIIGLIAGLDLSALLGCAAYSAGRQLHAWLSRRPLQANVALAAFCGFLMVFALAVTLTNTSSLAMLFEPHAALAWAWAAFIDLALLGFTVALAWFTAQRMRPWIVLLGFGFFVLVSTLANILISQDRLLDGQLIASLRALPEFFWTVGLVYSLSIPLAVFIFGKTIVDALAPRKGAEEQGGRGARESGSASMEGQSGAPALSARRAGQITRLCKLYADKPDATLADAAAALDISRVQAGEVRRLAVERGHLIAVTNGVPQYIVQGGVIIGAGGGGI